MMKYYYDVHIHTALSPCANEEMTPQNIVRMAKLCGLDIIAVADHNSTANVAAVIKAAKQVNPDLIVVPALELTTSEDIHVLCYFYELSDAEKFSDYVQSKRLKVPLMKEMFGNQYIMDSNDNIIGEEEHLLFLSSEIDFDELPSLMNKYNGVTVPAHINKESNSIYSVFGSCKGLKLEAVEVFGSDSINVVQKMSLNCNSIIHNSDAHSLEGINECVNFIELEEKSIKCFLDTLSLKKA